MISFKEDEFYSAYVGYNFSNLMYFLTIIQKRQKDDKENQNEWGIEEDEMANDETLILNLIHVNYKREKNKYLVWR